MTKKVRIKAADLKALRNFLLDSNVDLGCRPAARRVPDGVYTIALAEDDQLERLNARRSAGITIEVVEELPAAETRLRMTQQQNRFLRGDIPRGLGKKE